jgi:hypothetical protein
MSLRLEPKRGFDWGRVTWSRPDSSIAPICSYCSAGIPEHMVPLMLWQPDGHAAQFCDGCARRWWGMTSCPARQEEEDEE